MRIHAGVVVARFVLRGNNPGSPGFRMCGGTYTDFDRPLHLNVLRTDDWSERDLSDSASDVSCVFVVSESDVDSDSDVDVTSSGSWRIGNNWFR